jgi:hypothetical protein
MFGSSTFSCIILALLVFYLWHRVRLRHRAEERALAEKLRALDKDFPGRGFDVSSVAPRIKRLPQEYADVAKQRSQGSHYRLELFAATRRFVLRCSYFRRAGLQPDPQGDKPYPG